MLLKIICIMFAVNSLKSFTNANPQLQFNEANEVFIIGIEQIDQESLSTELESQGKFLYTLVTDSDQRSSKSYSLDCSEVNSSGIHDILIPSFSTQPFKVACDAETRNGNWTIILNRMNGSVNFYRNWIEYKNGFGNLSGEFFMGLDKLAALTAEKRQELLIILEDYDNDERFQTYDHFAIGNETEQYYLSHLGTSNGTAGDSFFWEIHSKFSTFDRDNSYNDVNCAMACDGAWWYSRDYCHIGQLTGLYNATSMDTGMNWYTFFTVTFSLKRAVMMIRPKT